MNVKTDNTILSGKGLTKVFGFGAGKTVAVDHVDFRFRKGEVISIVGESGSGKTTLAKMLRADGYLSHQSGKWWEGHYSRGGFTHGMTHGDPKRGGRHGDAGLKIGRQGLAPIADFVDHAVEKDKPFFVWYAPFLPHTPHNPPDRLLDKYKQAGRPLPVAKYYAMVEWLDETCGELMTKLEKDGLAEDTLVIYVTDNGWVQNPRGGGYLARSKRSPNEQGTRTPIMFRWPDKFKPVMRPELCTSMDIYPTILSAAGVDVPEGRDGLNLLKPLTSGEPIMRQAIFGESFAHDIADIKDPEASLLYRWVIKGNMKLLLTYDGEPGKMKYPPKRGAPPELYDLKADPFEENNLAPQRPEQVAELTKLLDSWYQPKSAKHSGNDQP